VFVWVSRRDIERLFVVFLDDGATPDTSSLHLAVVAAPPFYSKP
jgi:hypothetical protein